MDIVQILFDAIQAFREGDWNLHLNSFSRMMPYLAIYDHTNYSRWGPVYLSDMKQLTVTAPDVHRDFAEGNFVVKRSSHRFNQVPVDQATEWQNRMYKLSSGIIGITPTILNEIAFASHGVSVLIFQNKPKSYLGYKILIMKQYQLAKKVFHQE